MDTDTKRKINRIVDFQSRTISHPLNLLVTAEDTVAVQYFPYKAISHFVWIDREGIFRATSGDVKQKEIELMLAGKDAGIVQKNDLYVNPSHEAMFSVDTSNIKYKSMFTGYLDGLMDFKSKHRKSFFLSDIKGVRLINESLFNIINQVYNFPVQPNKVLIEGLNRDDVMQSAQKDVTLDWETKNTYCYELIAPRLTKEEIRQQAIVDIKNTFGITAGMGKRKIQCWVIKMDEVQHKKIQSTNKLVPRLLSLEQLMAELQHLDIPVVAETKYLTKLFPSFQTEDNFTRIKEADLQKFVKDNGLTLVKEEREMEVFVIKKVN
ncbi:hypothetical protein [Pedobacter frigoris]|uniref:hypothetical protein n=1 Tax=Pedobacter frigoris TaxID=2571272 RepID=UPI00292D745C|nr:hypothetical protein [Pedobacter frigoris]